MNEQNEFQLSPIEKTTLKGLVFIFFASAFMAWQILSWHSEVFNRLGMELPELSQLFLHSVWFYSPLVLAALLSSFVIYQVYRPHSRTILQCAWALGSWIIYLMIVLLAVSLPFLPACAPVG